MEDASDNDKVYRVYLCGGARCSLHNLAVLQQVLDQAVWDSELEDQVELCVGNCLGRCDHGPNLMIFPGSYRYTHVNAAAIAQIVAEHLLHGEPVADLLECLTRQRESEKQ